MLLESERTPAGLASDPIQVVRRYDDRHDQECMAVFAAQLAYGRVNAFLPVLHALADEMDRSGGPAAWVRGPVDERVWADWYYRWNRGIDMVLLHDALQAALRLGTLCDSFQGDTAEQMLTTGVGVLRREATRAAEKRGMALPRGTKMMLSSPAQKSACKRWNLFLRWVIRPDDGVDLGLWPKPSTGLVVPLDTHIASISRMLGWTTRTANDWKTATQITEALRTIAPDDPMRFDFALAHLGISGECKRQWAEPVCTCCPLVTYCAVAAASR